MDDKVSVHYKNVQLFNCISYVRKNCVNCVRWHLLRYNEKCTIIKQIFELKYQEEIKLSFKVINLVNNRADSLSHLVQKVLELVPKNIKALDCLSDSNWIMNPQPLSS